MTFRYIYGLFDPRYDCVRYIGMANDPWQRTFGKYKPGSFWHSHVSQALYTKTNNHKDNWIRQLNSQGLSPKLVILEFDHWTREETFEREVAWIRMCRSHGENLLNLTDGGDGFGFSRIYTDEAREKCSKAVKQVWNSYTDEQRAQRREKMNNARIAAITPEKNKELSRAVKANWDALTKEQRSARAKKTVNGMTSEQRSARAKKAYATRRARQAIKDLG